MSAQKSMNSSVVSAQVAMGIGANSDGLNTRTRDGLGFSQVKVAMGWG
jgi:hypothetical protein